MRINLEQKLYLFIHNQSSIGGPEGEGCSREVGLFDCVRRSSQQPRTWKRRPSAAPNNGNGNHQERDSERLVSRLPI